jgi:hypothetical protein
MEKGSGVNRVNGLLEEDRSAGETGNYEAKPPRGHHKNEKMGIPRTLPRVGRYREHMAPRGRKAGAGGGIIETSLQEIIRFVRRR